MVLTAIDWRRAGLQRPIPEACLEKLYSYYLRGAEPNSEKLKAGIDWGLRELYATSRLISYQTNKVSPDASGGYQPHDAVVQHIREIHKEPVPDTTFQTIVKECADTDDLLTLGVTAFLESLIDRVQTCFQHADERGSPKGAYNLGVLLQKERGDLDGAEAAFRRADKRGSPDGANNLGVLLEKERGDLDGAEAAWRRADERGSPDGAYNLAACCRKKSVVIWTARRPPGAALMTAAAPAARPTSACCCGGSVVIWMAPKPPGAALMTAATPTARTTSACC